MRVALRRGWAPLFAPWAMAYALREAVPAERLMGRECSIAFMLKADALLIVGKRVTEGMALELRVWADECLQLGAADEVIGRPIYQDVPPLACHWRALGKDAPVEPLRPEEAHASLCPFCGKRPGFIAEDDLMVCASCAGVEGR